MSDRPFGFTAPQVARNRVAMTTRWTTTWLSSVALTVAIGTTAAAETKRALVVVDGAAAAEQAIQMSETLLGLGFDVSRLEAPSETDLTHALDDLSGHDGPTAIYVASNGLTLADLTNGSDANPRFVFVDACDAAGAGDMPANVFVVRPGADCAETVAPLVQEWLTVPGLTTDQWELGDGVQVTSTLTVPYVFRPTTSDVRLTAEDYALLETLSPDERAQMIRLWRGAGIVVDVADGPAVAAVAPVQVARDPVQVIAPVSVAAATSVVRPVAPAPVVAGSGQGGGGPVVSRTLSPTIDLPTPGEEGRPQPSILVGFVVDALPDAPEVPDEPVAGATFGADDVAAREALRDQDAALFEGLVASGAFDPAGSDVARALQVELARINCYTAGIDGVWGPGSQRALAAFYELSGTSQPDQDPSLDDFRAVLAASGIRCPDPAPRPAAQPVAQAQPSQPSRAATAAPAQSSRAAPAPAPAPAAPSTPRRSISQTSGSGIFR